MKKILAVLLSLAVCGTAVYTAIAADDETSAETPVAVEENTELNGNDNDAGASDFSGALKTLEEDEKAQEIADQIVSAVESGASEDDVNSLLLALADYVNNSGFDVSYAKTRAGSKEFLDAFLTDCGLDTDELHQALDAISGDSDNNADEENADAFNGDAYSSDVSSSSSGSDGSYYYSYDQSTTIPDTGYKG